MDLQQIGDLVNQIWSHQNELKEAGLRVLYVSAAGGLLGVGVAEMISYIERKKPPV